MNSRLGRVHKGPWRGAASPLPCVPSHLQALQHPQQQLPAGQRSRQRHLLLALLLLACQRQPRPRRQQHRQVPRRPPAVAAAATRDWPGAGARGAQLRVHVRVQQRGLARAGRPARLRQAQQQRRQLARALRRQRRQGGAGQRLQQARRRPGQRFGGAGGGGGGWAPCGEGRGHHEQLKGRHGDGRAHAGRGVRLHSTTGQRTRASSHRLCTRLVCGHTSPLRAECAAKLPATFTLSVRTTSPRTCLHRMPGVWPMAASDQPTAASSREDSHTRLRLSPCSPSAPPPAAAVLLLLPPSLGVACGGARAGARAAHTRGVKPTCRVDINTTHAPRSVSPAHCKRALQRGALRPQALAMHAAHRQESRPHAQLRARVQRHRRGPGRQPLHLLQKPLQQRAPHRAHRRAAHADRGRCRRTRGAGGPGAARRRVMRRPPGRRSGVS